MRRFLYSRWFFLCLAIVAVLNLTADIGEIAWGWTALNSIAIALDIIELGLVLWIFLDLQGRRPRPDGDHTDSR